MALLLTVTVVVVAETTVATPPLIAEGVVVS
jgi:hypothetical protein